MSKVKTIIKLSATWCAPCKAYAPTFHKVQEMDEYKDIDFKEIDIEEDDEGEELATKYRVRSVPTTIIHSDNDEVLYKATGNIPQTDLINLINEAKKK